VSKSSLRWRLASEFGHLAKMGKVSTDGGPIWSWLCFVPCLGLGYGEISDVENIA
jgi:hypothetical protein